MNRARRSLAYVLLLTTVCSLFVVAAQPAVLNAQTFDPAYTVTTTRDLTGSACGANPTYPEECSLRQAINKALATGAANSGVANVTISFAIEATEQSGPTAGDPMPGYDGVSNTWTITLTNGPLPQITVKKLFIDGDTQATASGSDNLGPLVYLDGKNVTTRGGLTLQSADESTIWRLGIINFVGNPAVPGDFAGVGIEIFNSTKVKVLGCSIGVGQDGVTAKPNDAAGILIQGGSANTIGGNNSQNDEFNIISGNSSDGVRIRVSNDNVVIGNRIGTNRGGNAAIPNGENGVHIEQTAKRNRVGPPATQVSQDNTLRNTIAGNGAFGVNINEGSDNIINGNWIGLNNASGIALPNLDGGVHILSSTDVAASGNKIGGDTRAARNIISANGGPGVLIEGARADGNTIGNNYIGLGGSGNVSFPNTAGIVITGGGDNNIIGGNGTAARNNVIAANTGDAVQISGTAENPAIGNIVSGNLIGVTPAGGARGNSGNGVALGDHTQRSRVGGEAASGANTIRYSGVQGISIGGTNVVSNTVLRNTISQNTANGIRIDAAAQTLIDGGVPGGLKIFENTLNGIAENGTLSTTVRLASLERNTTNGLLSTSASATTVISVTASANRGYGIKSDNTDQFVLRLNSVSGNLLDGMRASGGVSLALEQNDLSSNGGNGVVAELGATGIISSNTVYSNTLSGVVISGTGDLAGTGPVRISRNSISGNGVPLGGPFPITLAPGSRGSGIVLDPTTIGVPGSTDNPNHDIDPPFDIRVNDQGQLSGKVRATTGEPAACLPVQSCRVEVFTTNPTTLDGQGRTWLDIAVTIDAKGNFSANLGIKPPPAQLAITVTDAAGNTSEFAIWTRQYGPLVIEPERSGSAGPGEKISYSHTIRNEGNVDFTDLQLTATSLRGWVVDPAPDGAIALAGGQSKPVTVSLTLPTGSAANVIAGLIEYTRVTIQSTGYPSATDTLTDTTTVLGKFILVIDPPTQSGSSIPEEAVDYIHTLRNNGNLTGTINLLPPVTSVKGIVQPGWTSSVTPTKLVLPPGTEKTTSVRVNVPKGAEAGTVASTITKVTGAATTAISNTTSVALKQLATMVFDETGDVGAGEKIIFEHTVTNLSNGKATFVLNASSSLGNQLTLRSNTAGIGLNSDGSFELDNKAGKNVFRFFVEVRVSRSAQKGQTDQITINLTTKEGVVIGGASVQDTVQIVRNAQYPVYMPQIYR